jgi:molybdate/tungstate transport system ATP-binding protein
MIVCEHVTVACEGLRISGVSFAVPSGAYGVLMGPTGCGKTTLLEAICGLRSLEGGTIRFDGRDVTQLRPGERNIGYVPQEGAVFPRMSVRDNLGFALSVRGRPRQEIAQRVSELAERLSIASLLDRQAVGLSGGEAQRVALGRALAARPAVLLLDEPLSALDDCTREQMMQLLKQVQHETGTTTLHVTHNQQETTRLADVRFEMSSGRIVELQPRAVAHKRAAPDSLASGN